MQHQHKNSNKAAKVMRWVARVWSLFALALALLIALSPDPHATQPISLSDILWLSPWGIAILGLLIAWLWERLGALITILTMFVRELVFYLVHREWTINFLLVWALVIPPAILFLLAAHLDRKQQPAEKKV